MGDRIGLFAPATIPVVTGVVVLVEVERERVFSVGVSGAGEDWSEG